MARDCIPIAEITYGPGRATADNTDLPEPPRRSQASEREISMQASDPVRALMTEAVHSIDASAPAAEMVRMFAAGPPHPLPVIAQNQLVGMLSASDVLTLARQISKSGTERRDASSWQARIAQLMRRPLITIGGDEPVEKAAALMAQHGLQALPVTDPQGKLAGIITTAHIARALQHAISRLKRLEALRSWADRYVHVGRDEQLHGSLLRAVEQTRDVRTPPPPLPI